MKPFKFKQLEIKEEGSWFKRTFGTAHAKRTFKYMLVGAAGGFLYFYLTEGQHMASIEVGDVFKSLSIGAFMGFFITNSPCARGRC